LQTIPYDTLSKEIAMNSSSTIHWGLNKCDLLCSEQNEPQMSELFLPRGIATASCPSVRPSAS